MIQKISDFSPDPGFFLESVKKYRRSSKTEVYLGTHWQVAGKNSLPGMDRRVPTRCGQVAGERYVIKRFGRKSRISPRIPDFSGFLLDQVTRGDLRIPKNQTL